MRFVFRTAGDGHGKSSSSAVCVLCSGQPAEYQKYGPDDRPIPGFVVCRYCKPAPWTSGSPARQGTYYRPIGQ